MHVFVMNIKIKHKHVRVMNIKIEHKHVFLMNIEIEHDVLTPDTTMVYL